ncbi:DUF1330 domain-containing protein [Synechococcus sp. UW105]|uniref:DUF1330 domain-containing protein n=2 Tax=unclassified Synechococcus TaxID=2626047 RepID=UPI001FCAAEB2|nr:DUF1330 domain-containing protein [Synechococcus sp. UW105]
MNCFENPLSHAIIKRFLTHKMAKGYWSVAGNITNPAGMTDFLAAFGPFLEAHKGQILCRELNTDVREGNPGHFTLIIEFENVAQAQAAYESNQYQEMIKLRQGHCDISLSILEEGDHASH